VSSGFDLDVAVVGGGAAGLTTAIFARRARPSLRVAVFDGARRPGAKILVSGGSRCNVTNVSVTERDFNGGRPPLIRRVLRAFPADAAVAWFSELGVPLHEEVNGKLFPDSNRSRDVLEALLRELARSGGALRAGERVHEIEPCDRGFRISTTTGTTTSATVVVATGGLALPKTGSDGSGYRMAQRFGHSLVPTTPALVPLVLAGSGPSPHRELSGVSHAVQLELRTDGRVATRVTGSLLWTHFGISGPATLDVSRHVLRAALEGERPALTANLLVAAPFEDLEAEWLAQTTTMPRATLQSHLGRRLPQSVVGGVLHALALVGDQRLGDLPRPDRRRLLHALVAWPLPVLDSRGYSYAEATAGGISLDEVDLSTMESRLHPGLFLVGEVLDVDGRLGGFNFQWAWSTGHVAGAGVAGCAP
jgi:hypothetical protein